MIRLWVSDQDSAGRQGGHSRPDVLKLSAFHMDYDKALNTSSHTNELSELVRAYNLNTWLAEAGGLLGA